MLHCPFLLGAVGRGPLFLEGDVVRLTKDASGLSRMETLEQAISSMSKRTGPRLVGPTFPASPAGGDFKMFGAKGAAAAKVHRAACSPQETPGSFGQPRFPKALTQ